MLEVFTYWYYATQMLHHLVAINGRHGIKHESAAPKKCRSRLGKRPEAGRPRGNNGAFLAVECIAHAFCIYCLEVYYRHLPLYDFR